MQYRKFGNLDVSLSVLGFGAMRIPKETNAAVEMLRTGIDGGINYVDTAPYYVDSESEILVGKALKNGYRDKVYLSTKNPIEDDSGAHWRQRLEKSLRQLDVEYIDFYHMWGLNWESYQEKVDVPGGPLEEAYRAKEKGLIRHISFSFHDKSENLFKIIDTGHFESMLVQYNLLDRSNEEAITYASQKGLGVVVMGPVGGGRLGAPSDTIKNMIPGGVSSTAEAALRFVISNPDVHVALSGMSSLAMVEENLKTAERVEPLSASELQHINKMMEENKRLAELYCTGCNYCMPCPHNVNIPENFRLMNYDRVYDLSAFAREQYAKLASKGEDAGVCTQCGECEPKCPQSIPIIRQLEHTAAALGE